MNYDVGFKELLRALAMLLSLQGDHTKFALFFSNFYTMSLFGMIEKKRKDVKIKFRLQELHVRY